MSPHIASNAAGGEQIVVEEEESSFRSEEFSEEVESEVRGEQMMMVDGGRGFAGHKGGP